MDFMTILGVFFVAVTLLLVGIGKLLNGSGKASDLARGGVESWINSFLKK